MCVDGVGESVHAPYTCRAGVGRTRYVVWRSSLVQRRVTIFSATLLFRPSRNLVRTTFESLAPVCHCCVIGQHHHALGTDSSSGLHQPAAAAADENLLVQLLNKNKSKTRWVSLSPHRHFIIAVSLSRAREPARLLTRSDDLGYLRPPALKRVTTARRAATTDEGGEAAAVWRGEGAERGRGETELKKEREKERKQASTLASKPARREATQVAT